MEAGRFRIDGVGEWEVFVPPTVYPPREDTMMLCRVISKLSPKSGAKVLEVGCGSGLVSIVLTTLGWEVTACDVNPYAVACARGNLDDNGLSGRVRIIEADIGVDLPIQEDTELIVWNLPYLDEDVDNPGILEKIEEAALTDIPHGGWGRVLLHTLENISTTLTENVMVILVMRTEPEGSSRVRDWEESGWSWRSLGMERFGSEKVEIIGFWRTGSGVEATIMDSCKSTMDEAEGLPRIGWQRVLSRKQTNGRGRRGSDWISDEGGLFATWSLDVELLDRFSPGLVQTSIGAIVSRVLGANMKWPNDIVNKNGVKIGGVLVESANNSTIRVGIGANRTGFVEGGVAGAGWDETLGEVDSAEVFRRMDRGISSIFETKKMIASAKIDFLRHLSWMELSRLLSRGVLTTHDDKVYRPTGLKDSGELEMVGVVEKEGVRDLDGIGWIIPKSCV